MYPNTQLEAERAESTVSMRECAVIVPKRTFRVPNSTDDGCPLKFIQLSRMYIWYFVCVLSIGKTGMKSKPTTCPRNVFRYTVFIVLCTVRALYGNVGD